MDKLYLFSKIFGIVLLVTGFILNYKISRRRFYRRSITGVEVFRSYEHSWMTRLVERIGKLFAYALILTGLMMILGAVLLPFNIN